MKVSRYKALDGLRAIAILFVISSHARPSPGMFEYPHWWWHLGDLGSLGVRIFFVLSGFIITHLLLREYDQNGHIDLQAFYVRRAFRILPPVIALMGVVGMGVVLGYVQVPLRQFVMALFFVGNYVGPSGGWTLGHLWSLAVEEQFYLLWPFVLLLTTRRTQYRYVYVVMSLILAPIMRLTDLLHGTGTPVGFIENADALAMGTLTAMMFSRGACVSFSRILESIPAVVSLAMIMILHLEPVPETIKAVICYPLIHLGVAAVILRVLRVPADFVANMLSTRVLVFIGVISYSLYLFQQPVFNRPPLVIVPRYPWSIICAFSLAIISHYCIERPSMKLREQFIWRWKIWKLQ